MFQAVIYHNNIVVGDGTFELIVLSTDEQKELLTIMGNNPTSKYQEAKFLSLGDDLAKKNRTVYIYIGVKLLQVKDFILGIFPSKIANYMVLPITKV